MNIQSWLSAHFETHATGEPTKKRRRSRLLRLRRLGKSLMPWSKANVAWADGTRRLGESGLHGIAAPFEMFRVSVTYLWRYRERIGGRC